MSDYAYGQPVPLTLPDASGAPANLASYAEVILTIVQPDNTSLVKKKSDASLTANPYSFQPTQAGRHVAYYVTTTPNGGTDAQPFNVKAAGDAAIVSLSEVKTHLNITTINNDGELQGFINAATAQADYWFGPTRRTSYTNEIHDGGWPTIVLFNAPVLSVETITEYIGPTAHTLTLQPPGSTVDNYGYSIDDPLSGVIVRRSAAGTPIPFFAGPKSVVVSYTVGSTAVSADVRMAVLEDIRGLWQQTQQARRPNMPASAVEDVWNVGPLRMFPRLAELASGPGRIPSIA